MKMIYFRISFTFYQSFHPGKHHYPLVPEFALFVFTKPGIVRQKHKAFTFGNIFFPGTIVYRTEIVMIEQTVEFSEIDIRHPLITPDY
jgi:hypothetical protein